MINPEAIILNKNTSTELFTLSTGPVSTEVVSLTLYFASEGELILQAGI